MAINKIMTVLFVCLTLFLAACSQNEKNTLHTSGIIGEGETAGYGYAVEKKGDVFMWKITRNGETALVEEISNNQAILQNFMTAVDDRNMILSKLLTALLFLFLVSLLVVYLLKKTRNLLKESAAVILFATLCAVYIAADASIDLTGSLQDVKLLYARLTN